MNKLEIGTMHFKINRTTPSQSFKNRLNLNLSSCYILFNFNKQLYLFSFIHGFVDHFDYFNKCWARTPIVLPALAHNTMLEYEI